MIALPSLDPVHAQIAALAGGRRRLRFLRVGSTVLFWAMVGVAIAAWFVPWPWQVLLGVVPLYWPLKVFWQFDAGATSAWAYALVGLAYQCLLLRLLAKRFARVVRR